MVGVSARRVGILGGAFDPPHLAHQSLLEAACEQLQLDEMRVVPTGQAWHKSRPLTPAADRLAMTQLAFGSLPKVVVDSREIARGGPSYTIDTLNELANEMPGALMFLIIGADQARALPTWRAWQEIVRIAIICVADRAHSTGADIEFDVNSAIPAQFRHLNMPVTNLSATDIRARISAHLNVSSLVCEPVARYIADHDLYQTA